MTIFLDPAPTAGAQAEDLSGLKLPIPEDVYAKVRHISKEILTLDTQRKAYNSLLLKNPHDQESASRSDELLTKREELSAHFIKLLRQEMPLLDGYNFTHFHGTTEVIIEGRV